MFSNLKNIFFCMSLANYVASSAWISQYSLGFKLLPQYHCQVLCLHTVYASVLPVRRNVLPFPLPPLGHSLSPTL